MILMLLSFIHVASLLPVGLWHPLGTTARCWAVQSCWRRTCCVWPMQTESIRSNTTMRTDYVTVFRLQWVTTRRCSSAAWERLHVSPELWCHQQFSCGVFTYFHSPHTHLVFWFNASVLPVVPLNIALLTVFGRRMTLTVLQLLAAIFFMMLNICTTMWEPQTPPLTD